MDDSSMPTTWHIDSQVPRTRADATGNVKDGYDIAFTTGEGQHGTVFVPMDQYTKAKVQALIHDQAVLVDGVSRLTHDSQV